MFTETVTVALISGLAVAIPSMIATYFSQKNNQSLIEYKLKELEEKVDKHNSVVERTFKLENDVKTAFKRIDDIRDDLHAKN